MNRILRIHGSRDHRPDQPVKAAFSALTGDHRSPTLFPVAESTDVWIQPQERTGVGVAVLGLTSMGPIDPGQFLRQPEVSMSCQFSVIILWQ